MARRPKHRAIRAARTYTIEEASSLLGVSIGAIRLWIKAGLPVMKAQRPHLLLGEDLKRFLQARSRRRKVALEPTQLFCLTCKAPRAPWGLLVDCVPQTVSTARLIGLCEVCGGTCNRMIGRSKIGQFGEIFDLTLRDTTTA